MLKHFTEKNLRRQPHLGLQCLGISLIILSCSSGWLLKADVVEPATNDPVALFKLVTSSTPDVEDIIGEHTTLDKEVLAFFAKIGASGGDKPTWIEGARSGSNFYLRMIPDPNGTNKVVSVPSVVGKSGNKSYELNVNSVTETSESTNSVADLAGAQRGLLNEFLTMGLADVVPASVVWTGNEFHGRRAKGIAVHGLLEISNNLPATLKITQEGDPLPYLINSYYYSDTPGLLSGFPSKIKIFKLSGNVPVPESELTIYQIRLAAQPLPDKMFDYSRFISAGIKYTNMCSNGVRYTLSPHSQGQFQKVVAYKSSLQNTPSIFGRRAILVFCGITTLAFVMLLVKSIKPKN
jgi:hypothetical protein